MSRALIFALAALVLAGCTTPLDAPISTNFGQAVASMDAQIIPATVSDLPPEGSAAQGVAAIRRLETDKVKKPPVSATSSIVIESSSESGGGSGDTP